MISDIDVFDFVSLMRNRPVIDVRTAAEYEKGHIPGARNLPLFSDEERARIGTIYKQVGRLPATQAGLDLVGPRLNQMVDRFRSEFGSGEVLVHCWRGGMRSQSVAWLMGLTGEFEPSTLRGGYKAYRTFALQQFARRRKLMILGGLTGSAKTEVLHQLLADGAQGIDLEGLAAHRGSAFGAIDQPAEPTQQQFENDLALGLYENDPALPLWLEDESRHIGRRTIPDKLWAGMRETRVVVIERSREERVRFLVEGYGRADPKKLIESIQKIERRLGGERAKRAVDAVRAGDVELACNLVLDYYDRTYTHGLSKRDPATVSRLDASGMTVREISRALRELE